MLLKQRLLKLWEANGVALYKSLMPEHWEYFDTQEQEIPEGFTVICYWKPGDNEGNYFHIDAGKAGDPRRCVLVLGKTLASVLSPDDWEILKLTTVALNWTRPITCVLED